MKELRKELKAASKGQLSGKWGAMVLGLLLSIVITAVPAVVVALLVHNEAVSTIIRLAISFATVPLSYGIIIMSISVSRNQDVEVMDIFKGYQNTGKVIGLAFVSGMFVFLWSLLLVIPGIIASLRYTFMFYELANDPSIGVLEAINRSKALTKGHLWEIFVLQLSFLGWAILCLFTCGVGYLWLEPYVNITLANYFNYYNASNVVS